MNCINHTLPFKKTDLKESQCKYPKIDRAFNLLINRIYDFVFTKFEKKKYKLCATKFIKLSISTAFCNHYERLLWMQIVKLFLFFFEAGNAANGIIKWIDQRFLSTVRVDSSYFQQSSSIQANPIVFLFSLFFLQTEFTIKFNHVISLQRNPYIPDIYARLQHLFSSSRLLYLRSTLYLNNFIFKLITNYCSNVISRDRFSS